MGRLPLSTTACYGAGLDGCGAIRAISSAGGSSSPKGMAAHDLRPPPRLPPLPLRTTCVICTIGAWPLSEPRPRDADHDPCKAGLATGQLDRRDDPRVNVASGTNVGEQRFRQIAVDAGPPERLAQSVP